MLGRVLLVWRTLMRHYRQHPAQGLFLLLGLSAGVAILLGTLIVSQAAKSAFAKAEHTIGTSIVAYVRPINGRKTLPQSVYTQLRLAGYSNTIPQIQGQLALANGSFITIKGIDLFALMHRDSTQPSTTEPVADFSSVSLLAFSYPPYQLWANPSLMQLHHFLPGQQLVLNNGLKLPAITAISAELSSDFNLLCDLRCAQHFLAKPEQLSAIALTQLPEDIDAFKALLPKHTALFKLSKNAQNQALSDAFFLNMTAVSLLAFLVGCFIAFNAVRFAMLQRQPLVKQLRLCGVCAHEVVLALGLELTFWALLATVVGSLLGWLIAAMLLPSVGFTLTQLFQGKSVLALPDWSLWWSYALLSAFAATTLAVAKPFWQLSQQKPLTASSQTSSSLPSSKAALVLGLLGCGLMLLPHSQILGFAITFCWFMAGALFTPVAIARLYQTISQIPGLIRYPKLHWLFADGRHNHPKLSIAMMAFSVAIAAGIGVSTMITSFESALKNYLDQVLSEDMFLQTNQEQTTDIYDFLRDCPDVSLAYRFYHSVKTITVKGQTSSSFIGGMSNHSLRHNSIAIEQAEADVWQKLHRREGVLINQTLAFAQQLAPGDKLSFKLNQHRIETKVLGIYYSYGSTMAATMMDQNWLQTLWPEVETVEIGVFLKPHVETQAFTQALQQRFDMASGQIIAPQNIKAQALKIFNQTFAATALLTLLTLSVAAIGIYCACYNAQQSQKRQLMLLKVLGIERRTLVLLSALQLLFNTLVASAIAIPLGLVIAWASVNIVLQYSFGWHFAIIVLPQTITLTVLGALVTALLAGIIPLMRKGKQSEVSVLKESV